MDKNKIIEAAGKLVAKGAFEKAIKEYQKVLDADPKDVRILQKVAELHQKKNDNPAAAAAFIRVAECYSNDGFFLKAVALYKQVLKLDPSLVDVNIRLAELHQQLQLIGEAMAFYQQVANHYERAGDTRKRLDVLRKMVNLDPENVAARDKLADLCAKEGATEEALSEFARVAEILKKQGRHDDYLRVGERILMLQPDNVTLARELAEQYLQRSDQKRALAKLQICFRANPRDIDTLRLLAVAFQGLGQTAKTISVYKELARALEEKGSREESERVWSQVASIDPKDTEVVARGARFAGSRRSQISASPSGVTRRPSSVHAAPANDPPTSPGAEVVQPAQPAQSERAPAEAPRAENLGKLLTETDVYVKYGLHDKALDHLRKVFAVEPENLEAHEKAYAIYLASHNTQQAAEQLLNVLRLHTRGGDSVRAKPYLDTILRDNPDHPEVPAFLAALSDSVAVGDEEDLDAAVIEEEPAADFDEAAPYATESDDEEIVVSEDDDEILSSEIIVSQESSSFLESVEAGEFATNPQAQVWDDAQAAREPEASFDPQDDEVVYGSDSPEPIELGSDEALESSGSGLRSQSGLMTDSLGVVMGTTPGHRFTTPLSDNAPLDLDSVVPTGQMAALADEAESSAAINEECDEALFFIEQGLSDEAREVLETVLLAYPGHARALELLASLDGEPVADQQSAELASSSSSASFDLATELADELIEFEAEQPEAPAAEDYQVSVEEVLSEFKKGLQKVVKPEDVDTHYDLGIAYKEMGLLDDALSEFEVARKGCVGKRKEIDCLSMVGMLQVMRGDAAGAVAAYLEAIRLPQMQSEQEKGLRFELAQALEGANQSGRALAQYLKVQALDEGYREVGAQVARLSAVTKPENLDERGAAVASSSAPSGRNSAQAGRKVGFI